MSQILITLFAGIESGYFNREYIQNWSLGLISEAHCPQSWLIDLLEIENEGQSMKVLSSKMSEEGLMLDQGYAELLLGFYYLRYTNNDIQLSEFETQIIEIVDSYDVEGIDPESLNTIFDKKPISLNKIKKHIDLLFEEYGKRSNESCLYIASNDLMKKESSLIDSKIKSTEKNQRGQTRLI